MFTNRLLTDDSRQKIAAINEFVKKIIFLWENERQFFFYEALSLNEIKGFNQIMMRIMMSDKRKKKYEEIITDSFIIAAPH